MARRQKLAFASCERRVVHQEVHLNRRRIDIDELERSSLFQISQRFSDEHLLETGQTDNVTGTGMFDLDSLQALVSKQGCHCAALTPTVFVNADNRITDFYPPAHNATKSQPAEII